MDILKAQHVGGTVDPPSKANTMLYGAQVNNLEMANSNINKDRKSVTVA